MTSFHHQVHPIVIDRRNINPDAFNELMHGVIPAFEDVEELMKHARNELKSAALKETFTTFFFIPTGHPIPTTGRLDGLDSASTDIS